jgi:hypothetical protein
LDAIAFERACMEDFSMSRSLAAKFVVAAAALSPAVVSADNWFTWRPWAFHTAQNAKWPEQYLDHDRSAARAPFAAMIANGWRSQNTVANYHFNEGSGELNDTGRLKVRSIVLETPVEWRTVYVLRGDQAQITDARVKSVQAYVAELSQGDVPPPVLITTVEPRGTRGDVANGVNQRFMENAPAPVIPIVSPQPDEN